ncbi:putative cyanovirin-N [Septoria linicola]|nr:putative cyanovirin-N [Septoria linicola]
MSPYLFIGAVLAIAVHADSGFESNCNSYGIFQPGFSKNGAPNNVDMMANCQYDGGSNAIYNVGTGIDLNQCFGVSTDGQFSPDGNGIGASCRDFGPGTIESHGPLIMTAQCSDYAGNYQSASIDLNDYIGNSNGRLTCFGRMPV